jgi:hypothetical protein
VFLVSDESAYAAGAEFVVDGGLTSYVPAKFDGAPQSSPRGPEH